MGVTVCVTGAGGYIASWLVKLLLSRGYTVHGTTRDPASQKNEQLKKLENGENLHLFQADLLDKESLKAAINGCDGVFHVASPCPYHTVQDPQKDLIEPAVHGTLNLLEVSSEAHVKKVVVVSSVGAVIMNSNWPEDQPKNEDCWSDKELCVKTKNWYCYSKTAAEEAALEYGKNHGLSVVTVCPSLVLGPLIYPTMNTSTQIIINILKGKYESRSNMIRAIVDIRDVVNAFVLVYEKTEAEGRYICSGHQLRMQHLINKMKTIYPNFQYPQNFIDVTEEEKFSSEKLQSLGWKIRPVEETLRDSIENYLKLGFLDRDH